MINDSSQPPAGPDALALWREQLAHLRLEEAITADALQKFAIKKQVEEAERKIRDLTPPESASPRPDPVGGRSDAQRQSLSDALDAAREEYERLFDGGADTDEIKARILGLKREIREGGRLRDGDDLLDGRYKLLDRLGHGGFATIFKARDRRLNRLVAIKVLHGQYGDDKSRVERFFRGARKMAELDHQGIVKVFDSDLADEGHHFFVMECLPGGDLRQRVLSGAVDPERALDLILSVGAALAFAHGRGIIHRDIKPANIVLDAADAPKLTDFDLVRAGDTTGGTRTGMLGTFIYAAPEMHSRPQDADARADLYGLGMTAIFALSGADPPWPKILMNAPGVIEALPVCAAVKPVLCRAIAHEIGERYPSVESFCAALARARLAAEPRTVVVRPDPAPVAPSDSGLPQAPVVPSEPPGPIAFRDAFKDGTGEGPEMVWLPGGVFRMGSPEGVGSSDERPAHAVTLGHYAIGRYPVTVGDFRRFVAATGRRTEAETGGGAYVWVRGAWKQQADAHWRNPYLAQDDRHPVLCVSWNDARAYCDWLGRETGQTYGLPSEAQWEHACRAGSETAYCFGDDRAQLGNHAWYSGNADGCTHPVGEKLPNPWGLHDLHGNVWEWCRDWYADEYYTRFQRALVGSAVPTREHDPGAVDGLHGDHPSGSESTRGAASGAAVGARRAAVAASGAAVTAGPAAARASGAAVVPSAAAARASAVAVNASSAEQPLAVDPSGPESGSYRVARGGAWYLVADNCRSACRYRWHPSLRPGNLGFRLSRTGPLHSYPFTLVGAAPPKAPEPAAPVAKPRFAPYEVFRDSLEGADRDGVAAPEMVYLPGGAFQMGDAQGARDEQPVHPVSVAAFALGRTPVTWGDYLRFCEATASHWPEWLEKGSQYHLETGKNDHYARCGINREGLDLPVVGISWEDARAYCGWLSARTGERYGLPTEAQWEYACRAGSQTRWCCGDDPAGLADYAWFGANAGGRLHPVGRKRANAWGLYDLHGNCWEWCADWYAGDYYQRLADALGAAASGSERRANGLQRGASALERNASGAAASAGSAAADASGVPADAAAHSQPAGVYSQSTAADASGAQQPASENPSGPETGSNRVVRGGAWNDEADNCRSAFRNLRHPSNHHALLGFRLSRTV